MFSKFLYKISGLFFHMHRFFFKAASSGEANRLLSDVNKKKWYKDNGDKTLRVEYPLQPSSVVIDVGGYEGDWAAEIHARYGCAIHIFEPVPSFVEILKKRFSANPGIRIHSYGLSDKDAQVEFHVMEESSSLHRSASAHKAGNAITVSLRSVNEVFSGEKINAVALIKINIEGGEYELLPALIAGGLVARIDNIQVQFHEFIPGAMEKMDKIRRELAKTHDLTWEYTFVWENWRIKK